MTSTLVLFADPLTPTLTRFWSPGHSLFTDPVSTVLTPRPCNDTLSPEPETHSVPALLMVISTTWFPASVHFCVGRTLCTSTTAPLPASPTTRDMEKT